MESQKEKKERHYGQSTLEEAIRMIKAKEISLSLASSTFNIPKGTLHNKLHGKTPLVCRKGPETILSQDEESHIATWVINMAKIGYPVTHDDVKDNVAQIFESRGQSDTKPGKKWFRLFMNRHPDITKRHAEVISKARAAITEGVIRNWFSDLKKFLTDQNDEGILDCPERIFNLDETGVQLCPKTGVILAPKNYRSTYTIAPGQEKQSVTVLCNFSASGGIVPPFIVYPLQRISKEVAQSVPDDWGIGRSDSGWMTGLTFFNYIKEIFVPWLQTNNITLPILLFVDGHKSHINMELHEYCVEHKIILYCLHPNTTHILQPCDVGIFGPLKAAWKAAVRKHKLNENTQLTRSNFAKVFSRAFRKSITENVIRSGFKACGLFPFNPEAVDYTKCISNRKNQIAKGNVTLQDYTTTITVIEKSISKKTLEKYDDYRTRNKKLKSTLFQFWSKCKNKIDDMMSTQSNIDDSIMNASTSEIRNSDGLTVTDTHTEYQEENHSLTLGIDTIVGGFLDIENMPIDIEGCNALLNDTDFMSDMESQINTTVASDMTVVPWIEPIINIITSTPVPSNSPIPLPWYPNTEERSEQMIQDDTHSEQIATTDRSPDKSTERSPEKSTDISDVFKLPAEKKTVKRKLPMTSAMPLAITSKKFKEYLDNKENEKKKKADEIKNRKIQREQKKAEKEKIAKDKKSKAKKINTRLSKHKEIDSSHAGTSYEMKNIEVTQDEESLDVALPLASGTKKQNKKTCTETKKVTTVKSNVTTITLLETETTIPDVTNNDSTNTQDIDSGSYVVVEFKTNRRNRYYVGEVVEREFDSDYIKVKFMRKKASKLDNLIYFIQPLTNDETEVLTIDVKRVLPAPQVGRRGMITFDDYEFDLSLCE